MNDAILLAQSQKELGVLVQEVLRTNRDQPLAELANSPLAHSSLVEDCFLSGETVSDNVRGRVMQAVLCWGIGELRPDGEHEWMDRQWRNYNVLFFPYIEEMRVNKLAEKMGFSEQNLYQRLRPKAIAALSKVFVRELKTKHHVEERKNYAVAARCARHSAEERRLLKMAAIFGGSIPSPLFYELAEEAGISNISVGIHNLLTANLLWSLEDRTKILIHSEIRPYQLTRLSPEQRQQWHRAAGEHYLTQQAYLEAASHFRRMGNQEGVQLAAQTVIEHQTSITNQHPMEKLSELVAQFSRHELPAAQWYPLKIVAGDLALALKNINNAIDEYGLALAAPEIQTKAFAYYRRAEAYIRNDLDQALAHSAYSIKLLEESTRSDRLGTASPLLIQIYIDRAWIFIQERQDLAQAEQALRRAQEIPGHDREIEAKLHNAWAGLYVRRKKNQKENQKVIDHRLQAWLAAEETQNLELKTKMAKNLGYDYAELRQEYPKALQYLTLSRSLAIESGDRQMEAMCTKDIGACYFWMAQYTKAIEYYKKAYNINMQTGNLNSKAMVCFDLTEAYAELADLEQAKAYFDEGVAIAKQLGHTVIIDLFEGLTRTYPGLPPIDADLNPRQLKALDYVKQHGKITKRNYVQLSGNIAGVTASRDLTDMCQKGFLLRKGKARGTYYTQP
ncbi:MAG: tetratricopeptide repeat protein [Ardenticatenaceae bacterium]